MACLAFAVAFWPTSPAAAAFPGQNGKIAYSRGDDVFVMNADGSAQTNLTFNDPTTARVLSWSPDGQKIAFDSNRGAGANDEIVVMNANGSAQANLTNSASTDQGPAWSSDGQKIAFESNRDVGGFEEIYVMNANGSAQTRLTNNPALDIEAAWSPDGTKIAFSSTRDGNQEIYVMNANGSGQTRLTNNAASDFRPNWSPDGQKIAFSSTRDAGVNDEIIVMNATPGSAQTNRTNSASTDQDPAWSPDGQKIAFESNRDVGGFEEIYVMNANGSAQTRLTNNPALDIEAAWSPDGTKIAFSSTRDGNQEIYVMNANGSGQTNLTNNAAADDHPAWSPNGQKIAFTRGGEIFVMNADDVMNDPVPPPTNLTNSAAAESAPDWQPLPPPIVFVHGFAGSVIACGGDQLYPDVPVEFPDMRLQADGETNLQQGTCNPLAAPTEILDSFLTTPVYGPAVEFLDEIAPDNNYIYVWDWRKSPQLALDELDLMVEQARCGGTLPSGEITCADPVSEKVVLMGHSMGGLVIRDYINDQPRADKVVRALTLGTPYWGSPKAIFPLAAGLELPAAEGLDSIIVDGEFQEWAKNAQGLYFLYPSASFGGWLTVAGRQPRPLDRPGLESYVSELGGTEALLERALDTHAQDLDGFKRNGVDFQAFVGSGLATIERVLFFEASGQDYVKLTYAEGDGTVPVRSGAQGPQGTADPLGENIPIHYSCGIAHVPLPGDPAITPRIEDFLVDGSPIVAGPTSCSSAGFEIEIYEIDLGPRAAAQSPSPNTAASDPTIAPAQGPATPMSLEEAEMAGLISLLDLGAQKIILTDSRTPVELSYSGAQFELNATPLTDAKLGPTSYYGPLAGEVTIDAGQALAVADDAGPVTPSGLAAKLKARKTQEQKGERITVKLTAGAAEEVTVLATGKLKAEGKSYKLKRATKAVPAGETKTLKLGLKKRSDANVIAAALRRGKRVTAALRATFTDEFANTVIEKAVVKLR